MTGQRIARAVAVLAALWAAFLLIGGSGVDLSLGGLRLRSNNWSTPAIVALVSYGILAWLRRGTHGPSDSPFRAAVANVARWLRQSGNLLLLGILLVTAVVRVWALNFGLPHPSARPDEEAISSMAGSYFHGNIEQTVFTYPPLFMLVVAAGLWLVCRWWPATLSRMNIPARAFEPSEATARLVARFLSAVAGVFSVWVLWRIGARLFGRPTGFVAAAFLALAFLHVRDSHFGVTDIPMTCMVLVGFYAIVKLAESGSRWDLVAAGILTGLAVATKYNAVLLIVPAAFAILTDPRRRPIATRLGLVVAFGAIMTAAFLIVCPYSVISYEKFLADVRDVSQHLAVGHGPDLGRGWIYHVTTTLRYGLGVPLLGAGVLGLLLMIWSEGRRGILVALFPIAYYAVTGSGRTVFARHALPLVPFLCLTAGYLVVTISVALTEYLGRPRWRIAATAIMTAAVVWPSLLSVIAFDRLIAREDSRVLARRWIEERFAPGTTMAQLGQSNGHPFIYYETEYTAQPATLKPTLVIVVSSPLDSPSLASEKPWLDAEYDLRFVQQVVAENDPANTYDRQDELFVPIGGFHQIERPGPNLRVYVRRDAAPALPR